MRILPKLVGWGFTALVALYLIRLILGATLNLSTGFRF